MRVRSFLNGRVRVHGGEGTPVPIPNTVVKLVYGDDTWLETARQNNSTRTFLFLREGKENLWFSFPSRALPYLSSNGFPLCCKPARHGPYVPRRTKVCKAAAVLLASGGRFYVLPAALVPARCNPFCVRRKGAYAAICPPITRRALFCAACAVTPGALKKARRGAAPFTFSLPLRSASLFARPCSPGYHPPGWPAPP